MSRHVTKIFDDIEGELERTFAKWGDQSHVEDGIGADARVMAYSFASYARIIKSINDRPTEFDSKTGKEVDRIPRWSLILLEEVFEALEVDEGDDDRLREELVQVASVATNWIKHIDQRSEG